MPENKEWQLLLTGTTSFLSPDVSLRDRWCCRQRPRTCPRPGDDQLRPGPRLRRVSPRQCQLRCGAAGAAGPGAGWHPSNVVRGRDPGARGTRRTGGPHGRRLTGARANAEAGSRRRGAGLRLGARRPRVLLLARSAFLRGDPPSCCVEVPRTVGGGSCRLGGVRGRRRRPSLDHRTRGWPAADRASQGGRGGAVAARAARAREKRLCACAGGGYQPPSRAGAGEGAAGSLGPPGAAGGGWARMEEAGTGRGTERRRRGRPRSAEPPRCRKLSVRVWNSRLARRCCWHRYWPVGS